MKIAIEEINLEFAHTDGTPVVLYTWMSARGTIWTQKMECDFELPLNKDEERLLRAILESIKERIPQQFTQQS